MKCGQGHCSARCADARLLTAAGPTPCPAASRSRPRTPELRRSSRCPRHQIRSARSHRPPRRPGCRDAHPGIPAAAASWGGLSRGLLPVAIWMPARRGASPTRCLLQASPTGRLLQASLTGRLLQGSLTRRLLQGAGGRVTMAHAGPRATGAGPDGRCSPAQWRCSRWREQRRWCSSCTHSRRARPARLPPPLRRRRRCGNRCPYQPRPRPHRPLNPRSSSRRRASARFWRRVSRTAGRS